MTDPSDHTLPPLTDPPFLVAILVGATRTGDDMLRELAEGWLAALGVRVTFDPGSPVIRPCSDPGLSRRPDGR